MGAEDTHNPCNLTPEEQDQLRILIAQAINLRGRTIDNTPSAGNISGFAPQTANRIVKWKNGPDGIITDSHLSDISANLVKGDILYASAADVLDKLAIGTNGQELQVSGSGVPAWVAAPTNVSSYIPDSAAKGCIVGGLSCGPYFCHRKNNYQAAGQSGYVWYNLAGFLRNFIVNWPTIPAKTIMDVGFVVDVIGAFFSHLTIVDGSVIGIYQDLKSFKYIKNTYNMGLGVTNGTAAIQPSLAGWALEFLVDDAACILPIVLSQASSTNQRTTLSATKYLGIFQDGVETLPFKTTEDLAQFVIPIAGTISNLVTFFSTTAQSATGSLVITLRKNSMDTTITVTKAASDPAADSHGDQTHTVSVVAGDIIAIKLVNNATATASNLVNLFLKFISTNGSFIIGGSLVEAATTATTRYFCPMCGSDATDTGNPHTVESNIQFPVPRAGTIKTLYVYCQTLGSGGSITLFKNGVSTSLTITVSGTGVSSDLTHSVSVAQGDLISLQVINSGTMVLSSWSAEFV